VAVAQVNSRKYFVSGEVQRPGQYALVSKVTALEAITLCGGLREFGNGKKIVIMRGKERIKFNYTEVLKGKKLEQNIELMPGDIVHVP
jgi:polysaccharide export outer membrane protein